MPRTRRYQLLRATAVLLACLLLGAATTLAIAWIPALRGVTYSYPVTREDTAFIDDNACAWVFITPQHSIAYSILHTNRHNHHIALPTTVRIPGGGMSFPFECPRVFSVPDHRHLPYGNANSRTEFQFGWPLRCMWGSQDSEVQDDLIFVRAPTHAWVWRSGRTGQYEPFTRFSGSTRPPCRAVPTGIIPRGAAINILTFTTTWWLVLFGYRQARLWNRRRHHLCPHCAYDLRATPPASPCPECGRAPSHASTSPARSKGPSSL